MIALRRGLVLAVLTIVGGGLVGAQEGGPAKPPTTAEPPRKVNSDKPKLPAGAIIFFTDQLRELLQLVPRMVILTPEEHQKLLDRISQLEKQIKPRRLLPDQCKLTAQIDGDVILVKAEFLLTTRQAGETVLLGCQGAFLTDVDLEGKLILSPGEDGYVVQAPAPGQHRLQLQFKLPLVSKRLDSTSGGGVERTFDLNLPGATVTTLSLTLPRTIKEIRRNDQIEKGGLVNPSPGVWELPLGTGKSQKIAWREVAPTPAAAGLTTARWDVVVRLEAQQVQTSALLTLVDGTGKPIDRRLILPADAQVEIKSAEAAAYEVTRQEKTGLTVIKGPAAPSLQVQVTHTQPRGPGRLPIGPFLVLNVERQSGEFEIRAAPEHIRGQHCVRYTRGDLRAQDIPPERAGTDLLALYRSWNLLESEKGTKIPKAALLPPLELELRPVTAFVETAVEHVLHLRATSTGHEVVVMTRIHATPLHGSVDFLDVFLPRPRYPDLGAMMQLAGHSQVPFPGNLGELVLALEAEHLAPVQPPGEYRIGGEGPAAGAELHLLPGQRKGRIALRLQKQPFSVALTGTYQIAGNLSQVRLELPRPLTLLDRGSKIKIQADASLELLLTTAGSQAPAPDRHSYELTTHRAPQTLELAWQPYRPQVPVQVVADVTITGDQGTVRQAVQFDLKELHAGKGVAQMQFLHLDLPEGAIGLRTIKGGQAGLDLDRRRVRCATTGQEPLVLEFDFKLPALSPEGRQNRSFQVPLLRPVEATQVDTRVRVWTEPGTVAALAEEDGWRSVGLEVVPERGALPSLVLRSRAANVSLRLLLGPGAPTLPAVVVDRGLIRVLIREEGGADYRCRFLLAKLTRRELDLELPLPVDRLEFQVKLDHHEVPWRRVENNSRVARLQVDPALYSRPVLLEVSYQIQPVEEGLFGLQVLLTPPQFGKEVFVNRLRWQVTFPPARVALAPGDQVQAPLQWSWRGWLLAPEPAITPAQLDQWLGSKPETDVSPASILVFWGRLSSSPSGAAPLWVFSVPRNVWLLVWSTLFLTVALLLRFAPLSWWVFWIVVVLLGSAVVAGGLFWPGGVAAVLYGIQPGLLVWLVILLIVWLLHQRYRRQVVFLPGFTRLKGGSSLVRGDSKKRPREPSTIDAAPVPSQSPAALPPTPSKAGNNAAKAGSQASRAGKEGAT